MNAQSPLLLKVQPLPNLEERKFIEHNLDSYSSRKLGPIGSAAG